MRGGLLLDRQDPPVSAHKPRSPYHSGSEVSRRSRPTDPASKCGDVCSSQGRIIPNGIDRIRRPRWGQAAEAGHDPRTTTALRSRSPCCTPSHWGHPPAHVVTVGRSIPEARYPDRSLRSPESRIGDPYPSLIQSIGSVPLPRRMLKSCAFASGYQESVTVPGRMRFRSGGPG